MNKISLLILFITSFICYSQKSISGFIVDDNNTPIEYANVFIQKTVSSNKIFGATTDENGAFTILLSSDTNQYKITVSFIGF